MVDCLGGGGGERGFVPSGLRIVAMVLSSVARCNCALFRYLEFGGRRFSRNGCEVLETVCIH